MLTICDARMTIAQTKDFGAKQPLQLSYLVFIFHSDLNFIPFQMKPQSNWVPIVKVQKTLQGREDPETSQELRMLSRSLSDCKLLLNVMIQVLQIVSNSQLCH